MKNELYVGLDVHKDSISTAVAHEGRKAEVRDTGAISNDLHALEKFIARLRKAHIPHGGFCPKKRLAADGILLAVYELRELPTRAYVARTERNVVESDATVILTLTPHAECGVAGA